MGTTTFSYLYDDNRSMPVILEDGFRKNVWGLGLAYAIDIQYLEAAAARRAAGMATEGVCGKWSSPIRRSRSNCDEYLRLTLSINGAS